ncbi:MAG TPA: hypothetical protein VER83_09600, partial [Candidatus Nanopelagicales bacterium]|nr:hypothetical protein [Candidatus Nanopelagicales bacterium]
MTTLPSSDAWAGTPSASGQSTSRPIPSSVKWSPATRRPLVTPRAARVAVSASYPGLLPGIPGS